MDEIKLSILNLLSKIATVDNPIWVDFKKISEKLTITEKSLDEALNSLDNERYINQFPLEKYNEFKLVLLQKGFDAVQDDVQ